jgi:hypothetical protein
MSALYNGLSEDGVLVSQVGQAVTISAPAQTHSVNRNRALFIRSLTDQGFVSIAEYNEVSRSLLRSSCLRQEDWFSHTIELL